MTFTEKSVVVTNFTLNEFKCSCGCTENHTKMDLLRALQVVRDMMDEPIAISSGYRCLEHNRSVGGKDTSSHIQGLAADIVVPDSGYAFRLLETIFVSRRFKRIGYGKMGNTLILHVDIDANKIQKRLWGY